MADVVYYADSDDGDDAGPVSIQAFGKEVSETEMSFLAYPELAGVTSRTRDSVRISLCAELRGRRLVGAAPDQSGIGLVMIHSSIATLL